MIFNSYVFILLLVITIPLYYGCHQWKKGYLAKLVLIGSSLVFYGFYHFDYVIILLFSSLWNYGFALIMNKQKEHRKAILVTGIIGNIMLLFYFKYTNFFISNMNSLFHYDILFQQVILPIGISFFTFQQIAYLIDTYKKKIESYTWIDFVVSTVFFPKISQGPITLHQEFIPQLNDKIRHHISYENLCKGMYMFALGLAKKLLLADVFALFVNYGYDHISTLNTTSALLVMLAYTMQIYFDFSGYSDMARGISRMLSLELPSNFNSPYKAMNIQDFWNRWHMSLTNFLTHYIYIPLGGNRKGKRRTLINVFLVFLISGLWHGANWTFLVWGVIHGIWSIIQKQYHKYFEGLHPAFNWLLTFSIVNVAWIFFRSSSLAEALELLEIITSCEFGTVPFEMTDHLLLEEIAFVLQYIPIASLARVVPYAILFGSVLCCLNCRNTDEKVKTYKPTYKNMFIVVVLLVWCMLSFSSVTTFIYFNF